MAKGQISNQVKNKIGALNSQVGMSKQQVQSAIGNANNQMNDQSFAALHSVINSHFH